jgi:hypothetical protein
MILVKNSTILEKNSSLISTKWASRRIIYTKMSFYPFQLVVGDLQVTAAGISRVGNWPVWVG